MIRAHCGRLQRQIRCRGSGIRCPDQSLNTVALICNGSIKLQSSLARSVIANSSTKPLSVAAALAHEPAVLVDGRLAASAAALMTQLEAAAAQKQWRTVLQILDTVYARAGLYSHSGAYQWLFRTSYE